MNPRCLYWNQEVVELQSGFDKELFALLKALVFSTKAIYDSLKLLTCLFQNYFLVL